MVMNTLCEDMLLILVYTLSCISRNGTVYVRLENICNVIELAGATPKSVETRNPARA